MAAFAVALEGLVADNVYFIASAVRLLVGDIDCCRDLLRASAAPAGR